jgi:hypothetical protein
MSFHNLRVSWNRCIAIGIIVAFLMFVSNIVFSLGQPENKSSRGYGTTPWGSSSPCPTGASEDTCRSLGAESRNPTGVYYVPKINNGAVAPTQNKNRTPAN